jgi:hypothetical protein
VDLTGRVVSKLRPDIQMIDAAKKTVYIIEVVVTNSAAASREIAMKAALAGAGYTAGNGWKVVYQIVEKVEDIAKIALP